MPSLEAVRQQLASAEDLRSVVKTMKAMAAVGIRQFEAAAASLGEYDRTVLLGLQAALREVAVPDEARRKPHRSPPGTAVAVAFGSDQGMCGQLNDRVAERVERIGEAAEGEIVVLVSGARLASLLDRSGLVLVERYETPSSLEAVTSAAVRVLDGVDRQRAEQPEGRVRFVFPRRTSGASYEIRVRQVLPLDQRWLAAVRSAPWPTRAIPAWPGSRGDVLKALVREYLFVSLYRALVDTLSSEHASRLSSMQSAEQNIEDRLDELRRRYRRQRQVSITSELMDVVAGFEALGEDES